MFIVPEITASVASTREEPVAEAEPLLRDQLQESTHCAVVPIQKQLS